MTENIKDHAVLSASGAHRWLICPASVRLEAKFPKTSSPYAEEGTLAHSIAELKTKRLLRQITTAQLNKELNNLKKNEFFTDEMLEYTDVYANFIKTEVTKLKKASNEVPYVELEKRVDFSPWVPNGFGTADCLILANNTLKVIDFKYGRGYDVPVEENPQMMLYALGACNDLGALYDIKAIELYIVQPRTTSEIKAWGLTTDALKLWADETVKPIAKSASLGQGEFAPSEEACKFCRAKGSCEARANSFLELFEETEPNLKDGLLSIEELSEILKQAKGLKTWLQDIENAVFNALMNGEKIPDWKIVAGRSSRKYTNELNIANTLLALGYTQDEVFEPKKVLSISKLEKTIGKDKLEELVGDWIIKPEGAPTLVPSSDKRQELILENLVLSAFDEGEN